MEARIDQFSTQKTLDKLNVWSDADYIGHISLLEQQALDALNADKIIANATALGDTDISKLIGKNACADLDPELFFPKGNAESIDRTNKSPMAKQACSRCEVRVMCLSIAINRREEYGTWGGRDEYEIDRILSRSPSERAKSKTKA